MAPTGGRESNRRRYYAMALLSLAVVSLSIFGADRAWAFSLGKVRVTGALNRQ
ncbi:MAG: hypothetical protein HQK85_09940, partial [Nitrospinae bacterium]|nr:hypothetical protein [Nitrospinota bacterium]